LQRSVPVFNMSAFGGYGPAKGSGPGPGGPGPGAMKGGPVGPYSGGPGGPGPLGMEPAELNEDGLPIRPGKDECLLYKNTGSCKNGTDCIFHHPLKSEQGKGGMMPIMAPMSGGTPPGMTPPPGMPSGPPGMSDGPQMSSSAPPMSDGPPMIAAEASSNNAEAKDDKADEKAEEQKKEVAGADKPQDVVVPQEVQYNEDGLPIRPTMQKCGFYMRLGRCNYGPTCRFDHPAGLGGLLAGQTGFGNYPGMIGGPMTEGGMAMRPGREQCPFLKRTKTCPFGPECRFDHSMNPMPPGGDSKAGDAPAAPKAPAPPVSRKKEKGLGGVRGRRNVPMWRGQP